jgi:hypothetical protein
MNLVWDSRVSRPQNVEDTGSSGTQGRKRGANVTLSNCDNIFCFLEDFSVLVCKQHHTAVVNLDTHLLQHHNVHVAARKQIIEQLSQKIFSSPKSPRNQYKSLGHR